MSVTLPKEIAEFVRDNILGCRFVGISSEKEVFLEFDHDDVDFQQAASNKIQSQFPVVSTVAVVVRPSIEQMTRMVEELNNLLIEDSEPPSNLLTIENF